MKKVELLAPAGNLDKLKMAILYGADAVYFAGQSYGLRANAGNFTLDEMQEGVSFCHQNGKKAYLTMNILAHNQHLRGIEKYIEDISNIGVDALIVSDPGILSIIKEVNPGMEIHLSTQANTTNYMSARFWHKQGVNRIIVARELSLNEISDIYQKVGDDLELEAFIHGAMCISYSGRCLLSNYLTNRSSNLGDCAHPCRWKYSVVEEQRPNEYMPIEEDEYGTYIFNSKDLCMINHIPQLIESGVSSLKIEGRMKSVFYVATIVKAYREAIDRYYGNHETTHENLLDEVSKVSHRGFTTGFFLQHANETSQNYESSSYIREYDFIGLIKEYDKENKIATIEQRNKFEVGDEIEIVNPKGDFITDTITEIIDMKGNSILSAPHPQMMVKIPLDFDVSQFAMIRKKVNNVI